MCHSKNGRLWRPRARRARARAIDTASQRPLSPTTVDAHLAVAAGATPVTPFQPVTMTAGSRRSRPRKRRLSYALQQMERDAFLADRPTRNSCEGWETKPGIEGALAALYLASGKGTFADTDVLQKPRRVATCDAEESVFYDDRCADAMLHAIATSQACPTVTLFGMLL